MNLRNSIGTLTTIALLAVAPKMHAQLEDTTKSIYTATQAEGPHKPKGIIGQSFEEVENYEGEVSKKNPNDGYNPLPDGILLEAQASENLIDTNSEGGEQHMGNIHHIAKTDSNYNEIEESIEHNGSQSQVSMVFNNMTKDKAYIDANGDIDINGINIRIHIPTENTSTGYQTTGSLFIIQGNDISRDGKEVSIEQRKIYKLTLPNTLHFKNNDHLARFRNICGLLADEASGIFGTEAQAKLEQWSK